MSTNVFKSAALAAAAVAALVAAPAQAAARVSVVSGAVKVRPSSPATSGATAATLAAAKNEVESFQVVLAADAAGAKGVSASMSPLTRADGQALGGTVTLFREALIEAAHPSGADGATGMWPDALIPDVDPLVKEHRNAFPLDVPANEVRAIWVDVRVPATAQAGVYTATLTLTGGVAATVPVTLTVWDFALPSTATLKTAFGLAWNAQCVGHWGDSACTRPDAESLRQRYLTAALDDRVSIETAAMGPPIAADGSGSWAHFDATYGPYLGGAAPTALAGARLTTMRMVGSMTSAVAAAWAAHFKAKGWTTELFAYVCDEPPLTCQWSDVTTRANAVHAGAPSVKTLVTTSIQQEAKSAPNAPIDILVPVVNFVEDKANGTYPGDHRAQYAPFLAKGGELWWYQSCMSHGCAGVGGEYGSAAAVAAAYTSGWPTYAIDSDATRSRSQEWMSFARGVGGELYYETTMAYYSGDPWKSQWGFGGNGDGTLFYPGKPSVIGGTTDIPIESIRLKELRDGLEDYELLHLADTLGKGAEARAIASGLFPHVFDAAISPEAFASARAELAGLILAALGKSAPAPVTTAATATPVTTAATATPPAPSAPTTTQAAASSGAEVPVGPALLREATGCSTGTAGGWVTLLGLACLSVRRG